MTNCHSFSKTHGPKEPRSQGPRDPGTQGPTDPHCRPSITKGMFPSTWVLVSASGVAATTKSDPARVQTPASALRLIKMWLVRQRQASQCANGGERAERQR
uniref:uncharacterized protein LOC131109074 isoform X2 n=1 Tax=Doryrhamphus excisus TaxID=161450 RepID=UPI0025AEC230|nr:uncharacterized protein LOC131109074 isoform X2 [Doryrhamphus excisus]XP_057916629.1 uncharacterized protein LOC131109074 isoform X2 [Doryrhamphus excisus]XP_057916630.1 uncharacterized protein LOC131109074 isoform X2 [Doryrhamphus excisus]